MSAIFKLRLARFFFVFGILIGIAVLLAITITAKFSIQGIDVHPASESVFDPDLVVVIRQRVIETIEANPTLFTKNNILFLDTSGITSAILESLPQVADVTISKHYLPRIMEIVFRERMPVAVWCNVKLRVSYDEDGEKISGAPGGVTEELPSVIDACFYIDGEGVVFQEAPVSRGFLITSIRDYENYHDVRVGLRPLSPEDTRFIVETKNHFKTELSSLGIKEFLYDKGEVTVITDRGLRIFLNRSYGPAKNVAVLKELLTKNGDGAIISDYLDLRITNKVYYK